jgi:hypothetical protein
VAMEACSSAHHWARELARLGHIVRLIPPAYVKPEPPANWWTPLLSSEEEREGVEWARDVVNLPMSSSGRQ